MSSSTSTYMYISAAISSVCAGCAAMFVTAAIEKLGGTVGGVLASMPTTIIPFCIALTVTKDVQSQEFGIALYSVPIGMLENVAFLLLWRELPTSRWITSIPSFTKQLLVMIVLSLTCWLIMAIIVVFALHAAIEAGVPYRVVGCVCAASAAIAGVMIASRKHVPSPRGTRRVPCWVYLARGCLAGTAIFISVLIASTSSIAAGLASTFPAIFLTTMLSLWISQSQAVPAGAAAPMMLGSLSVTGFAISFAELRPHFHQTGNGAGDTAIVACICDILSITFISIPVFLFLRHLNTRQASKLNLTTTVNASDATILSHTREQTQKDEKEQKLDHATMMELGGTSSSETAFPIVMKYGEEDRQQQLQHETSVSSVQQVKLHYHE